MATRKLSPEQSDIAIHALAFGVALLKALPSHRHRPMLCSDALDLFEAMGGEEKLIARARSAVSKHLQPVKVASSTL